MCSEKRFSLAWMLMVMAGLALSFTVYRRWLTPPEGAIACAALANDRLLIIDTYGRVDAIDVLTLGIEKGLDYTDRASAVALSKDGKTLAIGGLDGIAKVWDLSNRRLITRFQAADQMIVTLAISSDKRSLLTVSNVGARMWNLHTGELCHEVRFISLVAYARFVRRIGLSVVETREGVKVWNMHTGEQLGALRCSGSCISALAVSPDGRSVCVGYTDGSAEASNMITRHRTPIRAKGTTPVLGVVYSPSGKHIAMWDTEGTIAVWDLQKGCSRLTKTIDAEGVSGVWFSGDETNLLALTEDRVLVSWNLQSMTSREVALDAPALTEWMVFAAAWILWTLGMVKVTPRAMPDAEQSRVVGKSFSGHIGCLTVPIGGLVVLALVSLWLSPRDLPAFLRGVPHRHPLQGIIVGVCVGHGLMGLRALGIKRQVLGAFSSDEANGSGRVGRAMAFLVVCVGVITISAFYASLLDVSVFCAIPASTIPLGLQKAWSKL